MAPRRRVIERMTKRRTVLKGALGGLAGLSLPPFVAKGVAAGSPEITRVTDELVLLTGLGGNVLALSTREGLVLVDGGAAQYTDALLAALAELPGGSAVRTLFNTHWHLDQTGANLAIGQAGAEIVAHEKTKQRLATGYYLPAEERYQPPLPPAARPTTSFYATGATTVGDEHIEYGYLLEAHTDGDIYVFLRDSNVLAVGGAVSPVMDPELDWFGGGWLGGRVDSLDLLLEISDDRARFVPSDGPVVGRDAVQAERDMMLKLFERLVELVRKGDSPEDSLAAGVMDGLGRSWNDPMKFLYAAHKGLWAHHNTLSPDIV